MEDPLTASSRSPESTLKFPRPGRVFTSWSQPNPARQRGKFNACPLAAWRQLASDGESMLRVLVSAPMAWVLGGFGLGPEIAGFQTGQGRVARGLGPRSGAGGFGVGRKASPQRLRRLARQLQTAPRLGVPRVSGFGSAVFGFRFAVRGKDGRRKRAPEPLSSSLWVLVLLKGENEHV